LINTLRRFFGPGLRRPGSATNGRASPPERDRVHDAARHEREQTGDHQSARENACNLIAGDAANRGSRLMAPEPFGKGGIRRKGSSSLLKLAQFLAIVLTALALVPAGAHLFALPNKIALAQDQYFIVQSIYRGWALFGVVLLAALIANFALATIVFYQATPFSFAALAFLCVGATLVIFFVWTYPANVATNNWTQAPADWEALRTGWEYSHAANAIILFVALCSATLSALTTRSA
jgi:hypothetical protein